jgi:hypothetical protein
MTGALFGNAGRTLSFTVSEARYITYLVRWCEITKIQPRQKGDKRQGLRLFLLGRGEHANFLGHSQSTNF